MFNLDPILTSLADHFEGLQEIQTHTSCEKPTGFTYREKGSLRAYALPPSRPRRGHRFDYREDFCAFLKSPLCQDDAGPVLVNISGVGVNLRYRDGAKSLESNSMPGVLVGGGEVEGLSASPPVPFVSSINYKSGIDPGWLGFVLANLQPETGHLALEPSAEWVELMRLAKGVQQRELWRSLSTVLRDAISPRHLLEISALDLSSYENATLQIDRIGATAQNLAKSFRLTYKRSEDKSESHADVSIEWKFTIPRFKHWNDVAYDVECVLEFQKEGFKFLLHPRRPEDVDERALQDVALYLTKELESVVDRFPVFRGAV